MSSGVEAGLSIKEAANAAQHLRVHGGSYFARLRILLAGVVHAKKPGRIAGQFCFCSVRETESRARCDQAALFQNFEVRIPGDFSQREHNFGMQNLQ